MHTVCFALLCNTNHNYEHAVHNMINKRNSLNIADVCFASMFYHRRNFIARESTSGQSALHSEQSYIVTGGSTYGIFNKGVSRED